MGKEYRQGMTVIGYARDCPKGIYPLCVDEGNGLMPTGRTADIRKIYGMLSDGRKSPHLAITGLAKEVLLNEAQNGSSLPKKLRKVPVVAA